MKSLLTAIVMVVLSLTEADAQRGMLENHIGVRFGLGTGVSFQHLHTDERGFELIALGRFGGLNLTGLYEFHNQFFDVRGIKWYLGAGGHLGMYSNRAQNFETTIGTTMTAGIDGIIGLEYFMRDLPLMFSIDWKPAFN